MDAIYVRVSSDKQLTRSQDQDLKRWAAAQPGPVKWYTDKQTGTNFDRPGWHKLETDLHAGLVTRLIVWRLDRLGRTAGKLISLLEDLDRRNVTLVSLKESLDSTTAAGRLFRNMLASFAAYETETRSERVRAGIDAARAEGKKWGGRKIGTRIKVTEEKEAAIVTMAKNAEPVSTIARTLDLTRRTVYKVMERHGLHVKGD